MSFEDGTKLVELQAAPRNGDVAREEGVSVAAARPTGDVFEVVYLVHGPRKEGGPVPDLAHEAQRHNDWGGPGALAEVFVGGPMGGAYVQACCAAARSFTQLVSPS